MLRLNRASSGSRKRAGKPKLTPTRTREIGVRMALGAQRVDVLAMVLRQSMTLVAGGLAAGVLGALALTRFLREALYGLTPTDPMTYAGVSLLFVQG